MTLSELIAELMKMEGSLEGGDAAIRLVIKDQAEGQQYELVDAQMHEGFDGPMLLLLAGRNVAVMDWPSPKKG